VRRGGGAEERREKEELIIFGYKAQEISSKIWFTREEEFNFFDPLTLQPK